MTLRALYLYLMIMMIATGCNAVIVTETPTSTATSTHTPTMTPTLEISPIPIVTNTIQPTSISLTVIARNTPLGCQVRTDWSIYTVVQGDTLMRIASRHNTTTTALTQANCLADANNILLGQQLRVPTPVIIVTNTVQATTPSPEVWITQGSINISNYINADAGNYRLRVGEVVTLRWDNTPAALLSATFYTISTRGTQLELGTDISPNDGFSISWTVPENLDAHQLFAEGYAANAASYDYARSGIHYVYSINMDESCTLNITGNVNVYSEKSTDAELVGTLTASSNVTVLETSAEGWVKVQATYSGWLSPNSEMHYSGVCPAINS